jgi:hypothetical protein
VSFLGRFRIARKSAPVYTQQLSSLACCLFRDSPLASAGTRNKQKKNVAKGAQWRNNVNNNNLKCSLFDRYA